MKFFIGILFFTVSGFLFGEFSMISGFINDNYTGSTENGVSGNYIGADDFLTLSLFVCSKKDRLGISEYYQVVTSRKYGYRYDLLHTTIEYDFYGEYNYSPYFSLIYKTDLGGEFLQNSFHKFKDLPSLVEDYSETEFSPAIGLKIDYIFDSLFFKTDGLKGLLNIDIPFAIKPLSSSLALGYFIDLPFLSVDILGGYKQYFTEVDGYSEFTRSGLIYGGQLVVPLFLGISVNVGAFFFPVRNLINDPYYFSKSHNYSPQFWVTLGINGDSYGILDIVKY